MPELPEVETVCRGLEKAIGGQCLDSITLNRRDLRFPFPLHLNQLLNKKSIAKVERRAKYILLNFDNDYTLIIHLGMSGRMLISPQDSSPHDHVAFKFSNVEVVYRDPRRFGYMDIGLTADLSSHPYLSRLGIEPFSHEFNGERLARLFKNRHGAIKSLLLNQQLIAGLGNIYVCEALFLSGIHPEKRGSEISRDHLNRLALNIQQVLKKAIDAGGSSLKDHRQVNSELGYFQRQFKVYDQENNPCSRCSSPILIKRIIQAGRSTFYCEGCQT